MKKVSFFITITCVLMSMASAQISFFASDNTVSYGDTAIVRSWDDKNAAITYYVYNGRNYVQYVNYQTGDSYRCEVPDSTRICDMFIHNDIVYYCGSSTIDSVGHGIVGYFDPAELLSSNVTFHTLPVPPLTLVSKLVAQDNPNGTGVEVIALGEHRWNDTILVGNEHQLVHHLNRLFVFCDDITQNPVFYDTLRYDPAEIYYDVLLTDNYVVFVGHFTSSNFCFPSIRIRKRNTTPIPGSLLLVAHCFNIGTSDVHSPMHSTSMRQDFFATAYMHTDANTGVVTNRIHVFDVDINTNIVMLHSQEYVVPDKSELTDILYIPRDKSLVCMHDFVTPLNVFNTNFVYLDPVAANLYYPDIEYIKNEFFKSITRRRDGQYLASMGPKWFLKDKPTIGAYQDPYCPVTEKIESHVLDNNSEIIITPSSLYGSHSEQIIIDTENVEQRLVSIICRNP